MMWQVLAAGCIGSLFYLRRVTQFVRQHLGLRSHRAAGFVFASCYALVVSPVVCGLFQKSPVPRFGDIFLVGIVLTVYLFSWDSAVYLLAIADLVTAWVLPPYGTLAVSSSGDWYRLCSFSGISLFLIFLIHHLKHRRAVAEARREVPMQISGATAHGD